MGKGGRREQCLGHAELRGLVGGKAVFGVGWDGNGMILVTWWFTRGGVLVGSG